MDLITAIEIASPLICIAYMAAICYVFAMRAVGAWRRIFMIGVVSLCGGFISSALVMYILNAECKEYDELNCDTPCATFYAHDNTLCYVNTGLVAIMVAPFSLFMGILLLALSSLCSYYGYNRVSVANRARLPY